MKAEKLEQVEGLVTALNEELKIDEADKDTKKLEKQIRKIAKGLVADIDVVIKKKLSQEERRLAKEVKRQNKANRILAAQAILKGKIFTATTG
ncbi:hypothetical protein [Dyadobacter luticola]|uniref:Uncharacterized protein n=1 Tax=Dyadobacter luticola TaxID=1979387 RepID=A0A5R9L1I0_9BACT|nr:hypothetical protein [Dyadobacter luticola]TLV02414.1 hypothetical protein FEN17_01915 [Dyadobacter luticola]